MKKLLVVLLITFSGFLGAVYFIALPKAKSDIEKSLKGLGFSVAKVEKATLLPLGLTVDKIILDKEGFSHIKNLNAQLFWPTYLFKGTIDTLTIDTINIVSITNDFQSIFSLTHKLNLQNLIKIPAQTMQVQKILWETEISEGFLTFKGSATIQGNGEQKIIQASLNTNQQLLNFDSEWTGLVDSDGMVEADGKVSSFRIDYGPIRISRSDGWFSYKEADEDISFSGQMEAGSGALFNVPINNISFLIGQEKNHRPLLFRAEASGIEDVRIIADVDWSDDLENESMSATLNIGNLSEFLKYLKNKELIKTDTKILSHSFEQSNVIFSYMPEKRFADGPLPFNLNITENAKEVTDGTFLIYPNSFDIRGTAKANDHFIDLLKSIMSIPEENITDNVIRLDGNLGSLAKHSS